MPKTIHQQVSTIVQQGETERAIDFLTKELEKHPNRALYDDVSLLSGRFSSWERDFLRGVVTDSKEKIVVNALLLEYASQADESKHAPVIPVAKVSPDPLEVVEAQARRPHPRPTTDSKDQWTKYLVYGLGIAVLLVGVYWFTRPAVVLPDPGKKDKDSEVIQQGGKTTIPTDTTKAVAVGPTEVVTTPVNNNTDPKTPDYPTFNAGEPQYFFAKENDLTYETPNLKELIVRTEWYNDETGNMIFNFANKFVEASQLGNFIIKGQLPDGYVYGTFQGFSAEHKIGKFAFMLDHHVADRLNLFMLNDNSERLVKYEFVP